MLTLYKRKRPAQNQLVRYKAPTAVVRRFRPTSDHRQRNETKVSQITASNANSTAGSITLINGISTGSSINQRDARKIILTNLDIYLRQVPNSDFVSNSTRYFIILDNAPNGVTPAITDIFSNAGISTAQRVDTMWRFKILWQKNYSSGYSSTDSTNYQHSMAIHKVLALKSRQVQYIADSSTIADIGKGALYFVEFGSNVHSTWSVNLALRFKDI